MAASWAEMPLDLLTLIAKYITIIEDFAAFGAVCTSWRTAASKHNFDLLLPQVPLLMLGAKDDDYRELYNLNKEKVSNIYLPEARGSECFPSEGGWLCTVSHTGMNLLHPFSRISIKLPTRKELLAYHDLDYIEVPSGGKRWMCIDKAVLSANPSLTSDYALLVHFYANKTCLAYWLPGDVNWTHIKLRTGGAIAGITYYKGEFYCVTFCGDVWAFNVPNPNPRLLLELDDEMFDVAAVQFYLVEFKGALLLVSRFAEQEEEDPIRSFTTFKIQLFELDLIKGELKDEIKTLGDMAMFLGRNGAHCMDSSKFTGVKPNHIYFTDDYLEYNRDNEGGAGRDIGTYNLEDGKVESFYPGDSVSLICPPIWVAPSLIM